ncbi:sporulation protein YunB [Evansella sp. AB-P1]|uniref:sporulation protein YunB n=1 Tax=Evansella sp. AB-P1 TaxID=3037653 RepID=UPI00241F65E5|nr:sporulation protein YunB [Evansella sp. AB-P1]MDG5788910.1 sporulation protein YunB [Evansella sp. AB-P1]
MRKSRIFRPRTIKPRKSRPFSPNTKRRKGPLPFRYVILISFLIFCILTVQGLIIIEKGIRPTLVDIARTQTQKVATLAINDAMSKKVLEDINTDEILDFQMDNNGRIQSISWNTPIYYELQYATVRRVQTYLNNIEHGIVNDSSLPTEVEIERDGATFSEDGIIHMIPLGQATNNALLAHLGPRIPVRFSAIGDVKADLSSKVVELGINNTYLEISLDIEVDVRIVIPFSTDLQVVKTSIPVANFFHTGEVPDFYSSGGDGISPAIIQPPSNSDEDFDISDFEGLPGPEEPNVMP